MTIFAIMSAHTITAFVTAFLASTVEFVEALTIVLAVGIVRGWRHALAGAAGGGAGLALAIVVFGGALSRIPLADLQMTIGVLLLLFGMRWLHKAVLRAAGIIALHDEAGIYALETENLRSGPISMAGRWDLVALATAFKAVVLEGLEVVFIVIAVGGVGQSLVPAGVGAGLAAVMVIWLGVALHRPLTKVPENVLKFTVGVLISSFGVFWIGEGMGLAWPGGDAAIVALIATMMMVAGFSVWLARIGAGHPLRAAE